MVEPSEIEMLQQELVTLRKRLRELEVSGVQQKKVEETLLQSERKYRTIFENTGTATILIADDTTIAMVNTEYENLSGFSREDIEGKRSWTEFIVEEDLAKMIEYHYLRRDDSHSAPRNYEARLMNSRGEVRYCYLTVALIPETSQSIASLLDITERIDAEEARRTSEERYRLLVETMNDGLGIQDENGIITYANDRICQALGYRREEIVGRPTIDFLINEYLGIWNEQLSRRMDQYEPYEVAWRRKDGELLYTIVSPKPLFDAKGKYIGSFAIFTDITDRKKAEETIRISEEKFAKAFRSSPDAITISTLKEGRFIDVNDTFLRIIGRSREETIDHSVIELNIWPSPEYRRNLIGRLQEHGRLQNEEILFRGSNDDTRIGIYSAEMIDFQGEPCIISVFVDITEQKRLEKEILNISERERQKIGQDLHDDLQQHLIGIEAFGKASGKSIRTADPS